MPMTCRTIKLGKTDIETTALGFGTASLFRLPNAARRAEILRAAYDAGVRHFDVAPMYGLGLAETEIGRFARGRRDTITIATKFGIAPTRLARCLGYGQRPARRLLEAFPNLRDQAREQAAGPRSGRAGTLLYSAEGYHPAAARRSLERSLQALRTDYVDLFLLHDPAPGSVRSEDVRCCLEEARGAGLVRSWGLAGEPAPCLRLAGDFAGGPGVLQVRDDVWLRSARRVPADAGLITYGIWGAALPRLIRTLGADPRERARWTGLTGEDGGDPERLAALLLAVALRENHSGVVLFSTTKAERITQAIAAAQLSEAPTREAGEALDAVLRLTENSSDNSSEKGLAR
jgi:D-threo-aldose 1-dehydrogenase